MKRIPPPPRVSRAPTFPLVWIVPLLALAVAGWLLLRQWHTRGPEIVVEFSDGAGIEAGRTVLQHKGVTVGRVTEVKLHENLQGVQIRLRLERSAAALAREGSEFWVVQPHFSLAGIRGLETLFSGVHLAVSPGDGAPQIQFRGLDDAPVMRNSDGGRSFTLESSSLSGLEPGASVSYRGVSVGAVEECRLSEDSRLVLIRIRIEEPYATLVRPNTRFWSAGGLSMKIGLLGAQLNSGSLSSLLSPGISFATPDDDTNREPATAGTRFVLHAEAEDDWSEWNPSIPLHVPALRRDGEKLPIGARPTEAPRPSGDKTS